MITKAIIPVAGWGTRMLPITKAVEKCMLPVANRPVVDYSVQQCIAAGIRDIYFVVSGDGQQLRSYYENNQELDAYLRAKNKNDAADALLPPENVQFHFISQPTTAGAPYGTAVPVALAAGHVGQESVVVLMGDDFLYHATQNPLEELLIASHQGTQAALMAVTVDESETFRYGVIDHQDGIYTRIVEKPAPGTAPSRLINVSKYILTPPMLEAARTVAPDVQTGEYQIIDAINQCVEKGQIMKVVAPDAVFYDCGNFQGWLRANQELGDEKG